MFNQTIQINERIISANHAPYIIAEISGNHGNSFEQVQRMIDTASAMGVDAVKFQLLKPEGITLDCDKDDFMITDKSNPWYGQSMHELYSKSYLPWDWFPDLYNYCAKVGITCFSTPFDLEAVQFLETIDNPCYKIGSSENNDLKLIEAAASTGKPLIVSLGMADLADIEEIIKLAQKAQCKDLILMACACCYPAPAHELNLKTIPHLREMFQVQVGFSDHTHGIGAALASVALGAVAIEKHFMLSDSQNALDACFSTEEKEFAYFAQQVKLAWQSLGAVQYGPRPCEMQYLNNRRSLYVSKTIKKGEQFTQDNIKSVRPSHGLEPKYYDEVLGNKALYDLEKGDRLKWSCMQIVD